MRSKIGLGFRGNRFLKLYRGAGIQVQRLYGFIKGFDGFKTRECPTPDKRRRSLGDIDARKGNKAQHGIFVVIRVRT